MTAAERLEPHHPDTGAEEPRTYLTFELAGQPFAVAVRGVREILNLQPLAQLPNATADLLGVIDVRDEGVPVIDLCARLGLMRPEAAGDGRIIVFELGERRDVPVGVVADRVLGVVEIGQDDIEPAPETMTGWNRDSMDGICRIDQRMIMVLALERLFGTPASGPFDFA